MIDRHLTADFWLSEFLRSDIATRRGLPNEPSAKVLASIEMDLAPLMQSVRDVLGGPVFITSGYRSREVNDLVGGRPDSRHMLGLAADFVCPRVGGPRQVCKLIIEHADRARFDTLIFEGAWVHIDISPTGERRRRTMTAHFWPGSRKPTYSEGIA